MIKEIDLSEAALRDISRQIEDKKNVLINIEQQMDDVSSLLITSEEQQESSTQERGSELASSSFRVEWTQGFETPNHPRDGDTRMLSPKLITMEMNKDTEINLRPQRSRSLSGRRTSPTVPGAGMSPSNAGPARSPPTGEKLKLATVENAKEEEELTISAPIEVLSGDGLMTEEEASKEGLPQRARSKRKAKVSPGAHSLSEEEKEETPLEQKEKREARVILRKLKDRAKKACLKNEASVDLTGNSSLDETTDETGSVFGMEKVKEYRRKNNTKETMEVEYLMGRKEGEEYPTDQMESEEDNEWYTKSTGSTRRNTLRISSEEGEAASQPIKRHKKESNKERRMIKGSTGKREKEEQF